MLTFSNLRKILSGQIRIENLVFLFKNCPKTIINQLDIKRFLIQRAHKVV